MCRIKVNPNKLFPVTAVACSQQIYMACMKLGSKADVFHLDGQTWLCSTGLPSDIHIEVGEISFHLHKFPMLSRSGLLERLIQELSENVKCEEESVLQLHDLPGGAKSFLLIAKFCYSVSVELTAVNVVSLRCASEYLQMTEDYGEGNLIALTESFLNDVFESWIDSVKALETCEKFLPLSDQLHIICRCIDSLAEKACTDPSLLSWPVSGRFATQSRVDTSLWIRINSTSKQDPMKDDWWHEDVAFLQLSLFKKLILAVVSKGMSLERIAGSVMFYAKRHLPLHGRKSSFQNCKLSNISDANHRTLLEEIVELLPNQKGIIPTKFLLKLLRTSIILHASPSCRENLERRIGAQLDQAALEDLLIPNTGSSVETLYDIASIQRIVGHFMSMNQEETDSTSNSFVDEDQFVRDSYSLTPMTMVANLVDSYLAEVAPDVNLKLTEFLSLAAIIPDYARSLDDGIYRAIDIYLKAHPWLTDSEREELCRVMNFQKFSVEASTHAAQNERLPLRVIIQVLFFEQLQLRTSVAGCFYVSDNLENSRNLCGKMVPTATNDCIPMSSVQDEILTFDDMRERVSELEKECTNMKEEMEKLVKTKGSWSNFFRKFSLKFKAKSTDQKPENVPCNGEAMRLPRKAVSNEKQNDSCKLDD